jgi:Zn-dependent protease with chaperone function
MKQKAQLLLLTFVLSRAFILSGSLIAEVQLFAFLSFYPAQFTLNPSRLILFALMVALFVAGILCSVRGLINIAVHFRDSKRQRFDSAKVSSCDNNTRLLVMKAAEKAGVAYPTVLAAENIQTVETFGSNSDQAVVLVPVNAIKQFEPDEIECILMHEMYHIKEDVEYESVRLADTIASNIPINLVVTSAIAFGSMLVGFAFGTPLSHVAPFDTINRISDYIDIFGCLCICATLYASAEIGTIISDKHLYVRELFADAYAAIETRKPLNLWSAIKKIGRTTVLSRTSLMGFLGFSDSNYEEKSLSDTIKLSTIFFTRLSFGEYFLRMLILRRTFGTHDTYCPLKYRLALQKKLQQLLFGRTRIAILRPSARFWFLPSSIPEIEPEMQIPLPVMEVIQEYKYGARARLEQLLKYVEREKENFNLMNCSNSLRIEPFETFLLLVALIHLKAIDF